MPASTAARTARPRSTPAIERPDPVPMAIHGKRNREGRAPEFFLEARGDEPNDTRMPAIARHDDDGGPLRCRACLRLSLVKRRAFQLLTLAIEPVEFFSNRAGLHGIVQRQEPGAERGVADPASRIDARTDQKAEMIGVGRLLQARDIERGS